MLVIHRVENRRFQPEGKMPMTSLHQMVQHLRRAVLLADGAGLTDGQLLERFLSQRDAAALAVLVRRHGAMVWSVCRRLLPNHHDAEDAFQATFLVLVRRAASIVPREMLPNWLYGVARQTALKARATAARRKVRERQLAVLPEPEVGEPDPRPDWRAWLDQELSHLPEKYRIAIILCDLEGKTGKEAAQQLGWPEGTVTGRLSRGRAILAKRLRRRGLEVSGGTLVAAGTAKTASACVPASVMSATIQAASAMAAGPAGATSAVSAKVAVLMESMLRSMLLTKLKLVMAVVLAAAVVGAGGGFLSCRSLAEAPATVNNSQGVRKQVAGPTQEASPTPDRSAHFVVEAPTPQIAERVARTAERYLKEQALEWLGRELPAWPEPCPIRVRILSSGFGGATTFEYANGKVRRQHMSLEGSLDRLLQAGLPHEVTHILLAHFQGSPVPRWADEGAAILSEDAVERTRHDQLMQAILKQPGRCIPLRRLFAFQDYPADVMALHVEGYAVTRFLVESKDRATFLRFLAQGMAEGWDKALKKNYHYANVEELEQAWQQRIKQLEAQSDERYRQFERRFDRNSRAETLSPQTDIDHQLALAFGQEGPEVLTAEIRVGFPSLGLVLATNHLTLTPKGKVRCSPCWYAQFRRNQAESRAWEVTTVRCQEARLSFDGPVNNVHDLGKGQLLAIEPEGNVRMEFRSAIAEPKSALRK